VYPHSKYNPKWPSAKDISRERFYNYLGWLQLAAYECVFVHLWASGALDYHRSFFSEPGSSELSIKLTLYHLLHIVIVPYWRDFHFFFVHRGMHPWWNRRNGLLQGDIGAGTHTPLGALAFVPSPSWWNRRFPSGN